MHILKTSQAHAALAYLDIAPSAAHGICADTTPPADVVPIDVVQGDEVSQDRPVASISPHEGAAA